jgi:hypothetical protein
MSDKELIERLRKAASIWFKNSDLLLLEKLIRRYYHAIELLESYELAQAKHPAPASVETGQKLVEPPPE